MTTEDLTLEDALERARNSSIVTNQKALRTELPSTTLSVDDAKQIADIMLSRLEDLNGVGLSAIQLGIPYRICVVNVDDNPMWFLNPRIVGITSEATKYIESCLSLKDTMKTPIMTERAIGVHVEADNLEGTHKFQGIGDWVSADDFWSDRDMLQCVAIQHEIDHCNGVLITDPNRRVVRRPVVNEKKTPGRNERVMFENPETGETQYLKFKKGVQLLKNGWRVV